MQSILGMILVLSSAVPAFANEKDIVSTATADGYKTLVTAIKAANLVDTLKGEGPFTLFAPTDEAFAKLPAGMVEDLLESRNRERLRAILTYHVVAGRRMAADVAKLDGKSLETVQGERIEIKVKDGTLHVDKSIVIQADVATSNGVIHVIDTVLLPPASKRTDSLKATSELRPRSADSDAPLAAGFPGATNPGVIEVKKYPSYRSAVARANKASAAASDLLFFSLFNHIQRNKIEMTAPVINNFKTPGLIETLRARGDVSMEFVYHSPVEGKTGPDGSIVEVVDHPARHFVCLGFQGGNMSENQMHKALKALRNWLDQHKDEWTEDGPPRRLGYHGPTTPAAERLWEFQIPVKAVH